ncbi:helix-turn-helix domain-containing protein [Flavihumibacter fluvii]|uniref:helix-turn-helix domain-containing protein n=1 Tax=Flavihumibacter fluvii TaxID=2838157 RepID=UPI001BDED78E|nr:helix-turn-helix domain-containing protein [Flavihumibacter fluvii]ULQ54218.1 helix-turn-helix domain-containing protein [Flavihumibacter fluvii]
MEKITDWYFAVIFFAGFLGFVVAGILFYLNKNNSFPARLLAGFLVCISYLAINFGLMVTTFYLHFPHLWRAFGWTSFCYAPLAYIYVRSVLEQSYSFKRKDFLWFLPAILYTINLLPFYLWPAAEKIEFLENLLATPRLILREPEGLLPQGWGVWARLVIGVVATTGQFLLLAKWKKKILEAEKRIEQNIVIFRWLSLFSLVNAIFYTLVFIAFIFHFSGSSNYNYPIIFTICGTIFFVCISLLVRPSILYGMTGWLQEPEPTLLPEPDNEQRKNSLSISQGTAYKEAIENHFRTKLPFRKNGYTIGELSQELNIPSYQLSAFINQEYGKNFNELINQFRVNYLVDLVKTSPDYHQFTLEALGKEAGFNTRAAFISAVKKNTGKTPSDYFGRKTEAIEA